MNNQIILLLLLYKCAVLIEGIRKNTSTRIIAGQEAVSHGYPFIISLQRNWYWLREHFCGGTLVTEKWILSAAHCFVQWYTAWIPVDAVAGAHSIEFYNYGPETQVIRVDKKIKHPDFNPRSLDNDLALLNTKQSFILSDFIQPAKLPDGHKTDYNNLTIIGWGAKFFNATNIKMPLNLQVLQMLYLPIEKCTELWVEESPLKTDQGNVYKDTHICTAAPRGGGGCLGDSGGPLIYYLPMEEDAKNNKLYHHVKKRKRKSVKRSNNKEAIPVVVGVLSWTVNFCEKFTVSTRVQKYLKFINKYIGQ